MGFEEVPGTLWLVQAAKGAVFGDGASCRGLWRKRRRILEQQMLGMRERRQKIEWRQLQTGGQEADAPFKCGAPAMQLLSRRREPVPAASAASVYLSVLQHTFSQSHCTKPGHMQLGCYMRS